MEASRVLEGYQQNLPESVLHRIQQLHEKEARIVELEAELSQLRKDHAQLERDLEPYRIGFSFADVASVQRISREPTDIKTAPINRCPDEIICMIFENCVLIPYQHLYIRRLLLVCRRWYTLVTNTAKLWARIGISSPWDLFDIGSRKSLFSYIFACLARSKDLLITVDLDLESLLCGDYIAKGLSEYVKTIVDEVYHRPIIEVIEEIEWDECTSTRFEVEVERVIEQLVGVDGEHIKRWGTLTLWLPEWMEGLRYWKMLARGFKTVQKIAIYNSPLGLDNDSIIPDLTTVKYFKLTPIIVTSLMDFGLSPSALEHLHIGAASSGIAMRELSCFQRLHTLELDCFSSNRGESFNIYLLDLKNLVLRGEFGILAHLTLDFPSLDLLTIHVEGYGQQLPTISPRHIRWLLEYTEDQWIKRKKLARDFILLSNMLECITIEGPKNDEVVEVALRCKLEGKASLLTQIIVEHTDGEVERIQV